MFDLAVVYNDLGDRVASIRMLRKCYDSRFVFMAWVDREIAGTTPAVKVWRSDPVYQDILRSLTFPRVSRLQRRGTPPSPKLLNFQHTATKLYGAARVGE